MSKQDRLAIEATVGELLNQIEKEKERDCSTQEGVAKAAADDLRSKALAGRLFAGLLCDLNRMADAWETMARELTEDPADHDDNQEHLFEGPPS